MTKHSENTEPSNSTKPVLVAVCPSCKGKNTIKKENRKNNGIIGSGFASWVVDSWYSCKDCGTRFDLIKQPLTQKQTNICRTIMAYILDNTELLIK